MGSNKNHNKTNSNTFEEAFGSYVCLHCQYIGFAGDFFKPKAIAGKCPRCYKEVER